MATEVHLELLLGRRVADERGRPCGRIEEVIAEERGDECVVREYLVGTAALVERLSAWHIGLSLLKLLGARSPGSGRRVPWDKLDLSDPERPRLLCAVDELEPFTGGGASAGSDAEAQKH